MKENTSNTCPQTLNKNHSNISFSFYDLKKTKNIINKIIIIFFEIGNTKILNNTLASLPVQLASS